MNIVQIALFVFSCLSIWLFSRKTGALRRFGYVAGLCGQPFWIYTAIANDQWGIFLVSIWYTYCHIAGIKNNWQGKG